MSALGTRLEKLIAERNRLIVELRRVNKARFKIECQLDKLTHQLCRAVGLYLPGDVLPDPRRRKG
jgi:hypothetical protein